jgi:hypothetical protein
VIQIRFLVNTGTTMHPVAGLELTDDAWSAIRGDGVLAIESYEMAQSVSPKIATRVRTMAEAIQFPSSYAWAEALAIEEEVDRERAIESLDQSQTRATVEMIHLRFALGLLEMADTHFASQVQVFED